MSASKFSKATVCFVCFSLIFAVALIAAFSCGIIEMPAVSSEISAEAATGAATTDVLRDGEVPSGYSPSGTGISNIDRCCTQQFKRNILFNAEYNDHHACGSG